MSKILIVAKTKMSNNRVCVGGIDIEKKQSVRLVDNTNESTNTCLYSIREIWDVEYSVKNPIKLPHSEDIFVMNKSKIGAIESHLSMLDYLKQLHFQINQGSLALIFDDKLKCSSNGSLFISKDSVPSYSTCFWICNKALVRSDAYGRVRYKFLDKDSSTIIPSRKKNIRDLQIEYEKRKHQLENGTLEEKLQWCSIPFIGFDDSPPKIIPTGTLIRLSLARWWAKD